MKTKTRFRIAIVAMLVIVSLTLQSGGVTIASAGTDTQTAKRQEGNVPQPFTATPGVPFVPSRQPKQEPVSPDDSRTPTQDLPPLPPDPDKEGAVDETPPTRDKSYWSLPMSENFESAFPNGLWNAFDNNGAMYGEYYWDDDDFKPVAGSWSAWVANGGANGVDPEHNNYANYMDSWMMYGPFDLSGCAAADFSFYYWNRSEENYDWFGWGASGGGNVYGWQISGSQESWNYVDFDLAPYLGDTSVWLAFIFRSDGSVTDIGTFVDNVNLWCLTETNVKSWTYMVYLDGDNNLESAAIDDFMEMSSVGSSASVNIVALLDRIAGYNNSYGDWTETRRFYITKDMQPLAANGVSWGEANMGDPEVLLKFVRWAKAAYPANHYVLVLWDHGSGWKLRNISETLPKGISYDDTSSGDNINMPELRSTLNTLTSGGTYPFDILGLDACLMAMIEVDNQIKPYASIRVGSEELEPGDGWPYDTILSALVANPGMSATTLATNIVDFYYASYGNDQTQSAVNLGAEYTTLNTAVNNLAVALTNNGRNYISEIQAARNASTQFADTTYIDLWDFADWVRMYIPDPTISNAALAAENAVVAARFHEHHGASWPWARGISIYFPKTSGLYDARYDGSSGFMQFTAATQWDEWVHTYHNFANYPPMFYKNAPASGATGQSLTPTLSWGSSAGATAYEYCYDTSNDSACGGSWVSNGLSTSAIVGPMNDATTYYWQVRARNASGVVDANNGGWRSFTTGSLPTAFDKSGPANGATNQPLNPTLSWGTSSNFTSYEYCYDTSNDNACSSWASNGTSASKALSGLSQYTTYYWHVRALNTYGPRYSNGSSAAFWSFTTGGVPGDFNKSSPSNGAINQPESLTLSWDASSNAASYNYCYDTSDNNTCDGLWISNGASASAPISGLGLGTTYYWHVKAVNAFGEKESNSGVWWNFKTNALPSFTSAPILTATAGQLYSYDIIATDPDIADTLTVTAPVMPAWLTLTTTGNGTGTLSGIPTVADVGAHAVTLNVSDGFSAPVSQTFTIDVAPPPQMTFNSIGAHDGWVLESTETSNIGGTKNNASATVNLGDDSAKKQYRAILSFNTSALPDDTTINKVILNVKKNGVTGGGNPVAIFKGFLVEIKKGAFGTAALAIGDFQAAPSHAAYGPFISAPSSSGWYSFDLTAASGYINKLTTGAGLTQIRLRFKLDDNNNGIANFLKLYSGNAGVNSPQLIIEYNTP
jgi:hypothetical protein